MYFKLTKRKYYGAVQRYHIFCIYSYVSLYIFSELKLRFFWKRIIMDYYIMTFKRLKRIYFVKILK